MQVAEPQAILITGGQRPPDRLAETDDVGRPPGNQQVVADERDDLQRSSPATGQS